MYTRRARQKRKRHFVKKKPFVKTPRQQQPQQQPQQQHDLKTQSLPRCQCDPNCTKPPLSGKSPFCAAHAKKCTIRSPLSGLEPIYMPSLYNGTKDIQHNHNCFAYAFDVMDPPTDCTGEACKKPFHQPGYAAGYGKIGEKKYCSELLARLKGDMPWIKITKFITPCKPGYSKIAIVIDPNNDYHFYRQDSNGFWSHKPGGQPVTNLDASNKLIYNPEFCNRDYRTPGSTDPEELNYSIFCSFLEVPRNRPVHAKRGGGFILGDASSMKGGGKYHPNVQSMLHKMQTKKANGQSVRVNGTQRRAHRFTATHRPRFLGTIGRRVNAPAPPTATRRSTRNHKTPTRYTNSRTATTQRHKSNVPKTAQKVSLIAADRAFLNSLFEKVGLDGNDKSNAFRIATRKVNEYNAQIAAQNAAFAAKPGKTGANYQAYGHMKKQRPSKEEVLTQFAQEAIEEAKAGANKIDALADMFKEKAGFGEENE